MAITLASLFGESATINSSNILTISLPDLAITGLNESNYNNPQAIFVGLLIMAMNIFNSRLTADNGEYIYCDDGEYIVCGENDVEEFYIEWWRKISVLNSQNVLVARKQLLLYSYTVYQ
jgi:hypothetical protein